MKKLFAIIVSLAFLLSAPYVYAEVGAQTFTGNDKIHGDEQTVFIDVYNNTGAAVGSGSVVIIDTATTVASASIGSYFTNTTTAGSPLAMGFTLDNIPAAEVGRVCVRGVCKANLVTPTVALNGSAITYPAGASLATSTTSLKAATPATATGNGLIGKVLARSDSAGEAGNQIYYIWVTGPAI